MSKSKKQEVKVEDVATKKAKKEVKGKSKKVQHDEEILIEMQIAEEVQNFHDSMVLKSDAPVDTDSPFVKAPNESSEAVFQKDNVRDLLEDELNTRELDNSTFKFVRSAIRNNKTSKVSQLKDVPYVIYREAVTTLVKLLTKSQVPVSKTSVIVDELITINKMEYSNIFGENYEFYTGEQIEEIEVRPLLISILEEQKLGGAIDSKIADVMICAVKHEESLYPGFKNGHKKLIKVFDDMVQSFESECAKMPVDMIRTLMEQSMITMVDMTTGIVKEEHSEDIFLVKKLDEISPEPISVVISEDDWVKPTGHPVIDQVTEALLDDSKDVSTLIDESIAKVRAAMNKKEPTVSDLGTVVHSVDSLYAKYFPETA